MKTDKVGQSVKMVSGNKMVQHKAGPTLVHEVG